MITVITRKPAKRTYWIAFTKDAKSDKYPVAHYGYTEPNQETVSGQPGFEVFPSETKWRAKLKEMKIDIESEGGLYE